MGTKEGGGKERQVEGANSETGGRGTARVGTCPARVGTYQKSPFEDKRPKWHTAQAMWRLSFTRLKRSGMGTQEGGVKRGR